MAIVIVYLLCFSSLVQNNQDSNKRVLDVIYPSMDSSQELFIENFENWMGTHQEVANDNELGLKIPVIVHIIHSGENIGTGNNLSNKRG